MNFIIKKDNISFELKDRSPLLEDLKVEIEKFYTIGANKYSVSYEDMDGDLITIEDDDDLAVCILEFSEMSKIDESVSLVIKEIEVIPAQVNNYPELRKDCQVNEPRSKSMAQIDHGFEKLDKSDSVTLNDDTVSQLSERIMSIVDSKLSENLE